MVTDLSKAQESFELQIKIGTSLLKTSNELKAEDFYIINPNAAYRIVNNVNKYYVQINPKFCSYQQFLKLAVCKHNIAPCKLNNQNFEEKSREFVCVKKRGRPAKAKKTMTR